MAPNRKYTSLFLQKEPLQLTQSFSSRWWLYPDGFSSNSFTRLQHLCADSNFGGSLEGNMGGYCDDITHTVDFDPLRAHFALYNYQSFRVWCFGNCRCLRPPLLRPAGEQAAEPGIGQGQGLGQAAGPIPYQEGIWIDFADGGVVLNFGDPEGSDGHSTLVDTTAHLGRPTPAPSPTIGLITVTGPLTPPASINITSSSSRSSSPANKTDPPSLPPSSDSVPQDSQDSCEPVSGYDDYSTADLESNVAESRIGSPRHRFGAPHPPDFSDPSQNCLSIPSAFYPTKQTLQDAATAASLANHPLWPGSSSSSGRRRGCAVQSRCYHSADCSQLARQYAGCKDVKCVPEYDVSAGEFFAVAWCVAWTAAWGAQKPLPGSRRKSWLGGRSLVVDEEGLDGEADSELGLGLELGEWDPTADMGAEWAEGRNWARGCVCNATYVSEACCEAADGVVWEDPLAGKLGELKTEL
ncbi:MAG: hypothetical protein M1824_002194 [Vezdaea acicularis]|nr:MAG: hypothetical protein M1824_002194 [Vezdaea acicularis]